MNEEVKIGEVKNEGKIKIIFDKIRSFLSYKKNKYFIVVILCLIILIFFLSSVQESDKKTANKQTTSVKTSSWQEYCESQEHRLEYVLGSIKGIGDVKVFIMVDASPSVSYLENTTKSTSSNAVDSFQSTAVEVKNGTITNPVVVVERLPKILGVLVVAGGAFDVKLKNTLENVVSSILKVNRSNVEVLEGK